MIGCKVPPKDFSDQMTTRFPCVGHGSNEGHTAFVLRKSAMSLTTNGEIDGRVSSEIHSQGIQPRFRARLSCLPSFFAKFGLVAEQEVGDAPDA